METDKGKVYVVIGYVTDESIGGFKETISSIIGVFSTLDEAYDCVRSEMGRLRDWFIGKGMDVVYDPGKDPDGSCLWFDDNPYEAEMHVKEMELGEIANHIGDMRFDMILDSKQAIDYGTNNEID